MRVVLAALALTLAAAGCGGGESAMRSPRQKPSALTDLHSVFPLRDAFNDAQGSPRLVLVLSPT